VSEKRDPFSLARFPAFWRGVAASREGAASRRGDAALLLAAAERGEDVTRIEEFRRWLGTPSQRRNEER